MYCGADFNYLHTLAEFLPTDRPITILDAGANIGAASVLFSHFLALNGQVIAVEAFPPNFKILRMNVAPLKGTVDVVAKAIVAHDLADSGHKVNFTGQGDQFWGFRVDHTDGEWRADDGGANTLMQVDTVSLPMLKVRRHHAARCPCPCLMCVHGSGRHGVAAMLKV